jgi:two-component system sensor histidine kinase QseC
VTDLAPSIRQRLLVALIGLLLLVWLVVVVLVYRVAGHEVEAVFDADLVRSARTLQTLLVHEIAEERESLAKVREVIDELGPAGLARYPRTARILAGIDANEMRERLELIESPSRDPSTRDSGLVFVARYGDGGIMLRDAAEPELPRTAPGFVDLAVHEEPWRVYALADPDSGLLVQVGERHAIRERLARSITRNTVMPLLIAMPVIGLLVWLVVGRALRPLQRITAAVSGRAPDALGGIDERNAPREVEGLVQALNALFARVGAALERERQFTSDAAHELRTPLAAIKTHLQVARGRTQDRSVGESIGQAVVGVDRATHTVEQLLLLARVDAEQARRLVGGRVDLRDQAAEAVAGFSQRAADRGIDLGLDAPAVAVVRGDRTALAVLLRNLVDNALRYTPRGGTVTVSVRAGPGGTCLEVSDDGPGIAPEQREAVFERFNRGDVARAAQTTGSGLGLSIVQRIAALHGARVRLGPGIDGSGLGVRVHFDGELPSGEGDAGQASPPVGRANPNGGCR